MAHPRLVNRRQFLRLASAVSTGALVAACAPAVAPAGPAPAADAPAAAAPPPAEELVELEFVTFYTGADGAIMQGIIDRFNEEHPNIKANFSAPAWGAEYMTRIQTAGMAGNPPAVVALHNYEIPPLARYLNDISDSLATMGINKDDYVDVAWELPTYEGKLLGATMSTGTMALFYNKDLFEQAGLDPEKAPTNTTEFIEAATAINNLSEETWGFARDNGGWMSWYTMNWQHGGGLLNEDRTAVLFNTESGIESARLEQSFVKEHAFNPGEPVAAWDLMYAGNLGMLFHGPWNLSRVVEGNEQAGTNIGWAPHVQFFGDTQGIHSTSHIYCVTKQEPENPSMHEAGLTLIAWLLENGSLTWAKAQAPTSKKVLGQMRDSDDPLVRGMVTWVEQAPSAKFPPYHPQWGQMSTMLREGVERIVYQGDDAQVVLDGVAEQSNALLAAG